MRIAMENLGELPAGTREADSVLRDGEREYYDRGLREKLLTAVSAEREDGSRLLLTDRVWERSGDVDAVMQSRRGVRRVVSRGAEGWEASRLAAEAEESGETSEGRFERLAEKIAQITMDLLLYAGGKPRVKRFLQDGANSFVGRRDGIEVDKVTSGLDVSLYDYALRYIEGLGHFSGQFPVDIKQYDAMMERAQWVKRLENEVSARVLAALEKEFLNKGIDFSNLNLEVKLLEDGSCRLNVSPKECPVQGGIWIQREARSPRT